ncbi:MAG: nucleoside-diphosphate sugar epimerase [Flavobacteriales bacterium]|nr:nucleoside-diphosphate sugar epimerase [Flavobacteriales bacterium]|tara:strand:- start:6965 stop:7633 length:669 start_codon:yes stop_codon:yes gene_type:complete
MKSAIILGATGLTGSYILNKLLKRNDYSKIIVFSRRELDIVDQKLEVIICDLLNLEEQKEKFKADEVYVCVGTTNNKTPNKKLYRAIDFGIPVTAAQLCRENGIEKIAVISSLGANHKSTTFYIKTKGEMESSVLDMNISNTFLLRPSLILGRRKESRMGESLGKILFLLVNPFLFGPLKKYKSIRSETLADAMINLCNHKFNDQGIIESDRIQEVGKTLNE